MNSVRFCVPAARPLLALVVAALLTGACTTGDPGARGPSAAANPATSPSRPDTSAEEGSLLVPPGYGTLTQDQISLRLRRGELLIKVTPLEEWILRLTAPDTYQRLHGLVETHGSSGRVPPPDRASLFLVSLFSYAPDVTYEPEELLLVNRGLRYRPSVILPLSPSWGTQRLAQQEARMALYAFGPPLDFQADLEVEYQELRNAEWQARILPLLVAERARVRARAKGG